MQSMIFHGAYGIPLSVFGITHRLTFSKEMVDHDLRREAMKKNRSRDNEESGFQRAFERILEQIRKEEESEDEAIRDVSHSGLDCVAKAA